jgi:hypothetical protein
MTAEKPDVEAVAREIAKVLWAEGWAEDLAVMLKPHFRAVEARMQERAVVRLEECHVFGPAALVKLLPSEYPEGEEGQ